MTDFKNTMDKIESRMATLDVHFAKKKKYKDCNSTFPKELPPITFEEAEKAYKLLVIKFGKQKDASPSRFSNMKIRRWRKVGDKAWKTKVRKCWIALSGDVSFLSRGWRRLAHDISHMVYRYRNPKAKFQHSFQQAELELEIINYIISQDWLNGGLKSKVVVLTKEQKRQKKLDHYQKLISRWQTKMKLANTFVRKYNKKVKYLNKQ